eukprot:2913307-Amphidinium_carterae.1
MSTGSRAPNSRDTTKLTNRVKSKCATGYGKHSQESKHEGEDGEMFACLGDVPLAMATGRTCST